MFGGTDFLDISNTPTTSYVWNNGIKLQQTQRLILQRSHLLSFNRFALQLGLLLVELSVARFQPPRDPCVNNKGMDK